MLPVLFSLGPLILKTEAVFMFLAAFGCFFFVWKRGREMYFDEEHLFSIFFIGMFWYGISGRIGYGVVHWPEFGFRLGSWLNFIGKPGLFFGSGMLGLVIAIFRLTRAKKWDAYSVLDVIVMGMVVGQALLALGAFFGTNGGNTTQLPWGITYPGLYDKRHPVQLYEFIGFILIALYLWKVESKYRLIRWYKGSLSQARSGFIFAMYLLLVGSLEMVLSWFRPARIVEFGMSWDWLGWLLLVMSGGLILLTRAGTRFSEQVGDEFKRFSQKIGRRNYRQVKWK